MDYQVLWTLVAACIGSRCGRREADFENTWCKLVMRNWMRIWVFEKFFEACVLPRVEDSYYKGPITTIILHDLVVVHVL